MAVLAAALTRPVGAQTRNSSPRPPAPAAADKAGQGIDVSGALSESTVPEGQEVAFVLSISNHTAKPILSVQLDQLFKEGLTLASASWCDVTKLSNASSTGAQALGCGPLIPRLEAGQSITVSGRFSARTAHENERVIASVSWNDGQANSQTFAPLGELVIQSGWEQWRSSATYDLVKDLTLPFVLLVLGAALGVYDKHRENVRHRKQEELEDRRKQDAEVRAQTAQTWTSMLPESHKLATTYYMPVEAAASSVLDELIDRDAALKAGDHGRQGAAEDRAFYYLLLMSRRLRALADKKGGWYFKERVGEQLVARCLESFRLLFLQNPPEAPTKWSLAVGLIGITEKIGPFQLRVNGNDTDAQTLQEARDYLRVWFVSSKYNFALQNLRAMRVLLSFEMNRPYQYWYGSKEKLSLDDELKDTLRRVAQKSGSYPAIPTEDVEKYISEATS